MDVYTKFYIVYLLVSSKLKKMKTKPIEEILPEKNDEFLQNLLDEFSNCINETINFGTHILLWDTEKRREGKDNNIPTAFLRNIIEIGDSISILVKKSSIDPSKILLRSLMENSYQLQYMIEKNERQRSLSFMVWRAKKDINNYKQLISENQTSKHLKSKLAKDSSNFNIDKFMDRKEVENVINSKNSLLEQEEFKEINEEYINTSQKKKNPNWYSLYNGPENFEALSIYLKKAGEYEFNYRKYSENVHINGVLKGFAYIGNGNAQIIQIRDFENCVNIFVYTVLVLLDTYTQFVYRRIPEKSPELKKWYLEFKKEFDELKKVKINYKK